MVHAKTMESMMVNNVALGNSSHVILQQKTAVVHAMKLQDLMAEVALAMTLTLLLIVLLVVESVKRYVIQ